MEFTKEDEIIFENFFLLKEKRQFRKALKELDLLESKYKDNNVIHGLYGLSYFELNDFKNSAKHYRKVITTNPKFRISLIRLVLIFNTYWKRYGSFKGII